MLGPTWRRDSCSMAFLRRSRPTSIIRSIVCLATVALVAGSIGTAGAAPADNDPPTVPTGVRAQLDGDVVTVSWQASTDAGGSGLREYQIWRNGSWYDWVAADMLVYTDAAPVVGGSYQVRAVDNALNKSGWSAKVAAVVGADTVPPSVPSGLTATTIGGEVLLTWQPSTDTGGSGLREYAIYRNDRWYGWIPARHTTWTDHTPIDGASYRVAAIDNALNWSARSERVVPAPVEADTTPPPTPGGVGVVTAEDGSVWVVWKPVIDSGGSGLREYAIYRNDRWYGHAPSPATSWIDDAPVDGASYRVQAIDHALNVSVRSAPVGIDTAGCMIGHQAVSTVMSPRECAALLALYTTTGGSEWTIGSGWGTATDPCTWHGVSCGPSGVEALVLRNNGLAGSLPDLSALSHLVTLDLSFNRIAGSLPPSLADLGQLEMLNLAYNEFTGAIPTGIGALSDLRILYLNNNRISGGIPAELGRLSALEELVLGPSNLGGPIPSSLGKLENLELLFIPFSDLTGPIPAELGHLGSLERLHLSGNLLHGEIPAELADLHLLQRIELEGNRLTGDVAPAFTGLIDTVVTVRLADGQTGNDCFVSSDSAVTRWLDEVDPGWNRCEQVA